MSMPKKTYEFQHMSGAEKWKVEVLKLLGLGIIAYSAFKLVFFDFDIGRRLFETSGMCLGAFLYMNMFNVKSEVVELFQPPYKLTGLGLSLLGFVLCIASIVFPWL